jgi:uncharacterized protein YndB with AHSA1/START domain
MVRQSPQPETERSLADVSRAVAHGRTTVVFRREFAHSRDAVWAMLTDPELLARWSPFTADRNLSRVGRATLTMLDAGDNADIASVVFVADAGRSLEYSWADDTVSWGLEASPSRDGSAAATRLTLRQTLAKHEMASANAAGWHLCLEVASAVLAGHPAAPIRGMAAMDHGWADLNRRYAEVLGVPPTAMG